MPISSFHHYSPEIARYANKLPIGDFSLSDRQSFSND